MKRDPCITCVINQSKTINLIYFHHYIDILNWGRSVLTAFCDSLILRYLRHLFPRTMLSRCDMQSMKSQYFTPLLGTHTWKNTLSYIQNHIKLKLRYCFYLLFSNGLVFACRNKRSFDCMWSWCENQPIHFTEWIVVAPLLCSVCVFCLITVHLRSSEGRFCIRTFEHKSLQCELRIVVM